MSLKTKLPRWLNQLFCRHEKFVSAHDLHLAEYKKSLTIKPKFTYICVALAHINKKYELDFIEINICKKCCKLDVKYLSL